jgi:hypothetical protein
MFKDVFMERIVSVRRLAAQAPIPTNVSTRKTFEKKKGDAEAAPFPVINSRA